MVFIEGDDYRQLRRPGDNPAQFRSLFRLGGGSVKVPDPPGSIKHQYTGDNFTTSTWSDNINNADISIQGGSTGTIGGELGSSTDGVDDFGKSPSGPESLPTSPDFAIGMTLQYNDAQNNSGFNAIYTLDRSAANSNRFTIIVTQDGQDIALLTDDNSADRLFVETNTSASLGDGNPHLIVIQKKGDTASDISFYIDDMTTKPPQNVRTNDPYDSAQFTPGNISNFYFARASQSDRFFSGVCGLLEFNTSPYTQQERQDLKLRRPEV
jgi:hypothetical protein